MIDYEPLDRIRTMDRAAPDLLHIFNSLTAAHLAFQGPLALRTISVSDVLDNGSIEATFRGVRIKFELLLVFGPQQMPQGRVVCMHCHCTYGEAVQDLLGAFTFEQDGQTTLEADSDGNTLNLASNAAAVILHFLDMALDANCTL